MEAEEAYGVRPGEVDAGKLLLAAWGSSNGHVVKCITLARHAVQGGWRPVIVTYDNPVHLRLIEDAGFESIRYSPRIIPEHWWHCWLDATYIRAAVDADLQLITDTGADLVVHDNRPSMPVAADMARIGCGSICRQASCVGFEFPGAGDGLWSRGAAPYRKPRDGSDLPEWQEELNAVHRTVRARVEHTLARMKCWKILRDYRRAASTLGDAVFGIANLYNITLTR